MIYFTIYDHIKACLMFLTLGTLLGLLYRSLSVVFDFLISILLVFVKSFKACNKPLKNEISYTKRNIGHRNILDFFFFVCLSLFFIVYSYVTLDGEIRLYTALIFLVFFHFPGRLFYKPIELVLNFVLKTAYTLVFFTVYWALLPARILLSIVNKACRPIFDYIRYMSYKKSFSRFIYNESKRIEKFILNME